MVTPPLYPPLSSKQLWEYGYFYVTCAAPLANDLAALIFDAPPEGESRQPRMLRGPSTYFAYLNQYPDELLERVYQLVANAEHQNGMFYESQDLFSTVTHVKAMRVFLNDIRSRIWNYLQLPPDDPGRDSDAIDLQYVQRAIYAIEQLGRDISHISNRPEYKAYLSSIGEGVSFLDSGGLVRVDKEFERWEAETNWRAKLAALAQKIRRDLGAFGSTKAEAMQSELFALLRTKILTSDEAAMTLVEFYLRMADPLLGQAIDSGELPVNCELVKGLARGMAATDHQCHYQGLFLEMASSFIPQLIPGFTFDAGAHNAALKLATAIEKVCEVAAKKGGSLNRDNDPHIDMLCDGLQGLQFTTRKLVEVAEDATAINSETRRLNGDLFDVSEKDIVDALKWFWDDIDQAQTGLAGLTPETVSQMCAFSRQPVWSLDVKRILDALCEWVCFTRTRKHGIDPSAFRSAARIGIPDWQEYRVELNRHQKLLETLASSPASIAHHQVQVMVPRLPSLSGTNDEEKKKGAQVGKEARSKGTRRTKWQVQLDDAKCLAEETLERDQQKGLLWLITTGGGPKQELATHLEWPDVWKDNFRGFQYQVNLKIKSLGIRIESDGNRNVHLVDITKRTKNSGAKQALTLPRGKKKP